MALRLSALLAVGFTMSVVATAAAPSGAATYGDRNRGETLFFEHAFGASAASIPLKFFQALMDTDPAFAPETLSERYGLLFKPDRELPIGFVKANAMGMDRVSFNCSLCHTGTVGGQLVPGMPNTKLRMQEFEEAMFANLRRDSLNADALLPAIRERDPQLSWVEEMNLRLWIAIAKQQAESREPSPHRAGPGRFDLFQTFKSRLKLTPHDFNANMDITSLFGQRTIERYPRDGSLGGDQDLVRYLIVRLSGDSSPLKEGHIPAWVKDLNSYLYSLEPPTYPHPIDVAKARQGRTIFKNTCAGCHGTYDLFDEQHPNRIIPLAAVGTDPNRIKVWTPEAIAFVNRDPLMKKLDLQPGVGYMPPSLRGVWATAPYLHNGSVPTLHDVLSAPESRPKTFFRGGDGYDPVKVGLAGAGDFRYDTTISGNSNQGHPFGVPLTEDERWAVVEYLKTL